MIIRREVINFGIKTKHFELLGAYKDWKEGVIYDEYDIDEEEEPLIGNEKVVD